MSGPKISISQACGQHPLQGAKGYVRGCLWFGMEASGVWLNYGSSDSADWREVTELSNDDWHAERQRLLREGRNERAG